jgi:hypothetical protein
MRFCNLQAMEKQENKTLHPVDENALFFRRGRSGSGCTELQESTLREIQERTASLMSEANHQRTRQSSVLFAPAPALPNLPDARAPHLNGEAREPKPSLRL